MTLRYATHPMLVTEMSRWRFITFWLVALSPLVAPGDEGKWGHLTGRFVFDGDPPIAKTVQVTKDSEVFGDAIADESLIVNKKNQGIANVLVFLLSDDDDKLLVHPSYARTANAKVEFAMEHGRFEPHVLLLRTSQIMNQRNKDDVGHNAKIDFLSNAPM